METKNKTLEFELASSKEENRRLKEELAKLRTQNNVQPHLISPSLTPSKTSSLENSIQNLTLKYAKVQSDLGSSQEENKKLLAEIETWKCKAQAAKESEIITLSGGIEEEQLRMENQSLVEQLKLMKKRLIELKKAKKEQENMKQPENSSAEQDQMKILQRDKEFLENQLEELTNNFQNCKIELQVLRDNESKLMNQSKVLNPN